MAPEDSGWRSSDPKAFVAEVAAAGDTRSTLQNGNTMVWRIWGQGEPVVLLHGGYGSWTHWIRNVRQLAAAYRVIVPDLPGYGDSSLPPKLQTMSDYAQVIANGLDAILPDREPYQLVAFSFGSSVATHLLQFDHARISQLIIVGTSGLGRRTQVSDKMQRWRDLPPEARAAAHRHNLGVLMLHKPEAVDPLAVYLQTQNTERARLRPTNLPASGDRKQLLARYPLRLSGIWGAQDAMSHSFLDERKAALEEIDPACGFAIVPDAGHWVQYEAASHFNNTLEGMLSR